MKNDNMRQRINIPNGGHQLHPIRGRAVYIDW